MTTVTLMSDASYCDKSRCGGWGGYIACERGKQFFGGEFKGQVLSSIFAEMAAIINTLYKACECGLIQPEDVVLIQSDCIPAMDKLEGKGEAGQHIDAIKTFTKYCNLYSLTVEFRHVKGHTNSRKSRFYINNECDRIAYKHMAKARGRNEH